MGAAGAGSDPASGITQGSAPGAAASPGAVDQAASPVLSGTLQLDEKLAGSAKPQDTIFIAVRGVDEDGEAAGPPVAVGRLKVADLPHRFRFSDADAMMPTARLSGQKRVKIIARIGQDASPQSGDLQGESPVVAIDASDVKLVIDQRLP